MNVLILPGKRSAYKKFGSKTSRFITSRVVAAYLSNVTHSKWCGKFSQAERAAINDLYDLESAIYSCPILSTPHIFGQPATAPLFYVINEDFRLVENDMINIIKQIEEEFSLDGSISNFLSQHVGKKVCVFFEP